MSNKFIDGPNSDLVEGDSVSVPSNVRGGRVIAKEILYDSLFLTRRLITTMNIGQVITRNHVTVIREKSNKWIIQAQGVTNGLTILPDNRLQMSYLSGKLRNTHDGNIMVTSSPDGSSTVVCNADHSIAVVGHAGGNIKIKVKGGNYRSRNRWAWNLWKWIRRGW